MFARRNRNLLFLLSIIAFSFSSCTTVDLYEKTVVIPKMKWKNSFKPSFTFSIKDSTRPYKLFVVLRHNDKYNFSNLFITLHAKPPGKDTALHLQQDLLLATNEKGWLGAGMDDVYEHRIQLGAPQTLKVGDYVFTLEQIMREDPLLNVMDVGVRLEKQ